MNKKIKTILEYACLMMGIIFLDFICSKTVFHEEFSVMGNLSRVIGGTFGYFLYKRNFFSRKK